MLQCIPTDKKDIFNITINDEDYCKIHSSIFGKKPSLPSFNEHSEWETAFKEQEYQKALIFILKKLSQRTYLSAEIQKLLQERLVSRPNIEKIVSKCKDLGYLNDSTTIESFIQSQNRKGYGPQNTLIKLLKKGVDRQEASQIMAEWDKSQDSGTRALEVLTKKCQFRPMKNRRDQQKMIAFLLRKGFSLSVSIEVIKLVINKPLDFEN